jgi:hypothetical protein
MMPISIPSQRTIRSILFEEKACIEFLIAGRMLDALTSCPSCQSQMSLKIDRHSYLCGKKECRKEVSMFNGSFFAMCKLPCCEVMNLAYLWLCGASYTLLLNATHHSPNTITSFLKYFNLLVGQSLEEHTCLIGGLDDAGNPIEVELDESKIAKRKYHRGHHVEGAWILGGVERTIQRRLFVVRVPDRSSTTISQVISQFVKPGSRILTDCWKGYNYLNSDATYLHDTVNHSLFFKDPLTNIHTNTIEGTWGAIKAKIPKRNRSGENIDDQLLTFIWRRQNSAHLWNAFLDALRETSYLA